MQTVLITGAASGIGREAARLFAARGWQCVLVDRAEAALRDVARHLPAPGDEHLLRTVDLTDARQIASLRDGLPRLDALINNAGISDPSNIPLADQPVEQIDRLMALNLAAPAAVVECCAELLAPGARVVNVSSGAGLQAIPWRGAYSPSKAGLIAQTRALSRARPDWCATVLAPGFVRTELVEKLIEAGRLRPDTAVAKIPLGRMAVPAEMAHALFFLASAGAWPLRGQVLPVNGGSTIYGGSQAFAPATLDPLPLDVPMQLEVVGHRAADWSDAVPADTHGNGGLAGGDDGLRYAACLDVSPLTSEPGQLLHAVHRAAVRFSAAHRQHASLTLLLPSDGEPDWREAGDHAAACMLVSTLACEWGSRALRINALRVPAEVQPRSLQPLLRYVAGPAAQYLTGQVLVCGAGPADVRP